MTGDDEAVAMNVDEAATLRRLVQRLNQLDVEPPKDWAKKEKRKEWSAIAGLGAVLPALLWLGWPLTPEQAVTAGVVVTLGGCGLAWLMRDQDGRG